MWRIPAWQWGTFSFFVFSKKWLSSKENFEGTSFQCAFRMNVSQSDVFSLNKKCEHWTDERPVFPSSFSTLYQWNSFSHEADGFWSRSCPRTVASWKEKWLWFCEQGLGDSLLDEMVTEVSLNKADGFWWCRCPRTAASFEELQFYVLRVDKLLWDEGVM